MSFPFTETLDSFTRANAGTLGSDWGIVRGYTALNVASQEAAVSAWQAFQYYNTRYDGNQEVYVTVRDALDTAGQILILGLRITNPTTSPDGYRVEFRQSGAGISAYLVREATGAVDADSIDLGVTEFTPGDGVGASVSGSLLRVYFYDSALEAWAEVGSWSTATYQSAGFVGVGYRNTASDPIPAEVYVATVTGGVYHTDTFTGPDDATQPTWAAVNTGLPVDGSSEIHVSRFWVDPFDPTEYQYAHIIDDDEGINSIYRRDATGGAWVEIISLAEALAAAGVATGTNFPRMRLGVDDENEGHLFVAVSGGDSLSTSDVDSIVHILRSTNRGDSFASLSSMAVSGFYGIYDPYIVVGDKHRLRLRLSHPYRSDDGGINWQVWGASNIGALLGYSTADPDVAYGRWNCCTAECGGTGTAFSVGRHIAKPGVPDNDIAPTSGTPDCNCLYGSDAQNVSWGGMWLSGLDASFQRLLRRKNAADTAQELFETSDAWTSLTKIAEVAVMANREDIYRQYLPAFTGSQYVGWALLGFRTPNVADYPHTVYALDDDGSPVGKAGGSPEVSPFADSIPYTAGGSIDDGVQITTLSTFALADSFGGGSSAAAREDAIRTYIDNVLDGVTGLGNVYNYERWMVERDKFLAIAESDNQLLVFWIKLDSITPERMGFQDGASRAYLRNFNYRVRGWWGLKDAEASELDAVAAALRIMDALDSDTTLHDGQSVYDTTQATLSTIEPRTFYGILTHYIEIALTVSDYNA